MKPADVARMQADIASGKTATDERTRKRGRAIVRGGKGIAGRATTCFGTMMNFAVNRGLVPSNPAHGVQTDKEVTHLAETLTAMENEALVNGTMAAAIRLLMLTGARKSEILSLKWDYIDWDRSLLRLPDSKSGAKVVPLAAPALEILASLPRKSEEWVFPGHRGNSHMTGIQKAWEAIREKAGLSDVRIHDLRHNFASFAVADGASLFLIGKVLGHRQSRTTEIYSHIRDDPLQAVADRTAARISEAMKRGTEKPSPDNVVSLRGHKPGK